MALYMSFQKYHQVHAIILKICLVTSSLLMISMYAMESIPEEQKKAMVNEWFIDRKNTHQKYTDADFKTISKYTKAFAKNPSDVPIDEINQQENWIYEMALWNTKIAAEQYFKANNAEQDKIYRKLCKFTSMYAVEDPIINAILVQQTLKKNTFDQAFFTALRWARDAHDDTKKSVSLINIKEVYTTLLGEKRMSPVDIIRYSLDNDLWQECNQYLYSCTKEGRVLDNKALYCPEIQQLLQDRQKITLLGCLHAIHGDYTRAIQLCISTTTTVKLLEKEPIITTKFIYDRFITIFEKLCALDQYKKAHELLIQLLQDERTEVNFQELYTKMMQAQLISSDTCKQKIAKIGFGLLHAYICIQKAKNDIFQCAVDSSKKMYDLLKDINLHDQKKIDAKTWQFMCTSIQKLADTYQILFAKKIDSSSYNYVGTLPTLQTLMTHARQFVTYQLLLTKWHCFNGMDGYLSMLTDIAWKPFMLVTHKKENDKKENTFHNLLGNMSSKEYVNSANALIAELLVDIKSLSVVITNNLITYEKRHLYSLLYQVLANMHGKLFSDKEDIIRAIKLARIAIECADQTSRQSAHFTLATLFIHSKQLSEAIKEYILAMTGINNQVSIEALLQACSAAIAINDKDALTVIFSIVEKLPLSPVVMAQINPVCKVIKLNTEVNSLQNNAELVYDCLHDILQYHNTATIKHFLDLVDHSVISKLTKIINNIISKSDPCTRDIDLVALHMWLVLQIIERQFTNERSAASVLDSKKRKEVIEKIAQYAAFASGSNACNITTQLGQFARIIERIHRVVVLNELMLEKAPSSETAQEECRLAWKELHELKATVNPEYQYIVPEIDKHLEILAKLRAELQLPHYKVTTINTI